MTGLPSRVTKLGLKLICVLLAIYYSIVQAERFLRNEDSSQISFRHFNEKPKDQYPEFTFCLGNGAQFKNTVNEFRIPRSEFFSILEGNESFARIQPEVFKTIAHMHPNSYFTDLTDVLKALSFESKKSHIYFEQNSKNISKEPALELQNFFRTTHRDPDQVCFSRDSTVATKNKDFRKEDVIVFDRNVIGKGSELTIFVHHPGQFISSLESPVADIWCSFG